MILMLILVVILMLILVVREAADGEQDRDVDQRADWTADDEGGRDEREIIRIWDEQEEQLDILWNSWRNERDSASADDKGRGAWK